MRIALLSWESLHSILAGGVGRHVSELAGALHGLGHDVHVFTRIARGQTYYQLIDGVHYHRCPYLEQSDFVDDVNSMCRAFVDRVFTVEDMTGPFDIVHAHDWLAANAMIWIRQVRNRAGMLTMHSTEYGRCGNTFPPGRSERIRFQERAGTYWAGQVICVSNALCAEITWMYEVPTSKIHVIPNGVAADRFQRPIDVAAVRRRYDIGPDDPTILYCGRMEWQKGPDILLEAMTAVLQAHSSAKLIYVGDGSMRPGIENRARQLGLGPAVRFLGSRDEAEIASLYQISDGVCVPSRNEPFGIVILEAWSAGKPVIVGDQGGAREVVRHEYSGLHVSPTPASIASGIDRLLSDPDRARWMGENGREESAARYAWPAIAQRTAGVYGLIAPRAAPEAEISPRPTVEMAREVARKVTKKAPKRVVRDTPTPARNGNGSDAEHSSHEDLVPVLTSR